MQPERANRCVYTPTHTHTHTQMSCQIEKVFQFYESLVADKKKTLKLPANQLVTTNVINVCVAKAATGHREGKTKLCIHKYNRHTYIHYVYSCYIFAKSMNLPHFIWIYSTNANWTWICFIIQIEKQFTLNLFSILLLKCEKSAAGSKPDCIIPAHSVLIHCKNNNVWNKYRSKIFLLLLFKEN